MIRRRTFACLMCLAAMASLGAAHALAAPLSELEARGKKIYLTGIDNAGPDPIAFFGAEQLPAPARLSACGSCHGEDGRGRPEGNITPSEITWDRLTDGDSALRGELPESIISKAVAQGVGRNGKRLDTIMPRYALSDEQMRALQAYMRIIATDQAPGVATDAIRVAVIFPAKGATAAHDVIRQMCLAYFEALNLHGGVFNRRIEVVTFDADEALDVLKGRIEKRDFFALILLDAGFRGEEISRLADEMATPSISASAYLAVPESRYRFSIFPDVATQMRVLVDFVAQAPNREQRIALVYALEAAPVAFREAIERQLTKWGRPKPIEIAHVANSFDAQAAVAKLSAEAIDSVIFLDGGAELATFLNALKQTDWRPRLLISSSAIGPALFDAPDDVSSNILFPLPLLADQSAKDVNFRALREAFDIPRHHAASQVAAYCAALMFAKGLKLAGREISRTKFLEALENLRDFNTGVSHRLSFGPNRHVGSEGAYIVGVDKSARQFKMVSEWKPPR